MTARPKVSARRHGEDSLWNLNPKTTTPMDEQNKSTKSPTATCRVFISYSHDSTEHEQRVRALADQLRDDGIDAQIDQYAQDPDEGWVKWMRTQVKKAEKALLVFTETYQRRFEGDEEEGKGMGATFEGVIITQSLYESGGRNAKFRPVLFGDEDAKFIPVELRRFNRYRVDMPEHYQNLLRWLYEAPRIVPARLGQKANLPPDPSLKLFASKSDKPPVSASASPLGSAQGIGGPETTSKCHELPGSIGALFKGRAEFLQKLQTTLEAAPEGNSNAVVKPVAIHGLGGVGKTRAAVEYGYRHWDDYTALLLVRADSPEALRRNLADLTGAVVTDLDGYNGSDQETRLAAVLRWLAQHPRWFLILDNVDTEAAAREVERLLAHLRGGHLLITTRVPQWSLQVEPLELELLDEAAAVVFLEESTRQRMRTATDAQDVRALAQVLDGLALALQQAAAHINSEFMSFGEYLRIWRETRQDVLEWFDERLMVYPVPLAITWQTTFDQLKGPARALLGLLSHLASVPIPRGVLKTEQSLAILTAALATTPGATASDPQMLSPSAVNRALTELGRFSLVRFLEAPPATFSLHRLVQEVVRSRLGDATQLRGEQALALVQAYAPGDTRDASTWPQWAALAPHLESLFDTTKGGTDHPHAANLLSKFADYLRYRGAAPATAVRYYERALALHRQLGDRGAEGRDLIGLGYCQSTLGDNARAREHFLQAVDIHHALGHLREEGDARCGLGYAHCGLSNFAESIAEFERARAIHRQIGNPRGEAEALCGMGAPLWDSGRLKAAQEAYQQGVLIHGADRDIQGEADARGGLGWCCWGQGKHRQAIGHFESALAIYREIDDRQGITANLCGLGDAWIGLGDFDQGTAFLREALELCRKSNDDYWKGVCLWGLAYASQQVGDHQTAIAIWESDLKLMRERTDQRGIAVDLNWLGQSYAKLGKIELARACFDEALTISRAIDDQASEALALHGLGRLDNAAGEASLATERYERAHEIIRSVNDFERERDILRDLGEAFAALGEAERAADSLAHAERLSRKIEEWNRLPDH